MVLCSTKKLGFIQGRLSPLVNGRVQCFPEKYWREEFPLANNNGFDLIEWTLDQDNLYQNPLMTSAGRNEIRDLCSRYNMKIPSLTGDCFMQAPIYKENNAFKKNMLLSDFINILHACDDLKIQYIVFPLVDNGALKTDAQSTELKNIFDKDIFPILKDTQVKIVFESDFEPHKLKRWIQEYDPLFFGINYDIGNSASLGYCPEEEITLYSDRIYNVHIKDRVLGGATVPLGKGNANFTTVFYYLNKIRYKGNYILQTARASDDNHVSILCQYRDQVLQWI